MPHQRTTLADLTVLLDQRTDDSSYWTPPEKRIGINEGLREWNLWTGRWRRTITLLSVVGQHEYTLPDTLTYGMAVQYAGTALHPASYTDLDWGQPGWRTETAGSPLASTPVVWAPQSLQQIVLWPAPAAANVTISVDGVSDTPVLVEDGDWVDLSDDLIDIIVDYALHVLAFKEGGPRWQATLPYWQALLQAVAKENSRLKANQAFRRAAGLDYRRGMTPSQGRPTLIDNLGESA